MKQSYIRASLIALGALFAGACASAGDGSDGWELENGEHQFAEEGLVDGDEDADVTDGRGEDFANDLEDESFASDDGSFASDGETLAIDGELGTLQQALGGSCGSKSSFANRVVTKVAVPDHFPPDSALAQLAAVAIGVPIGGTAACAAFGVANMSSTCDVHDACYGEFGATKASCDKAAKVGWERACKNTYDSFSVSDGLAGFIPFVGPAITAAEAAEQGCRTACLAMARVMFQAVSTGGGSAFQEAQRTAAPRPPPMEGPFFF